MRAVPIDWPDNVELRVPWRGALNGLVRELTFADGSSDNVLRPAHHIFFASE